MQIYEENTGLHGHIICTLRDLEGNIVEVKEYDNLVVTASKAGFAGRLNNETSFTGVINYGAVGTSTSTPASGDTTLGTELARVVVSSNSRASNVATIEFYYSPTEANGTLTEFGAFIDGTATANSGTLFDRVTIAVTKTSLNSLTISLVITVS